MKESIKGHRYQDEREAFQTLQVSPRKCAAVAAEMIVHTMVFALSMQSYVEFILPILTLPYSFISPHSLQSGYYVLQAQNGLSARREALSPVLAHG